MTQKRLCSPLAYSVVLAFFAFAPIAAVESATLFFAPESGTFKTGEKFWVTIMIDTKGEQVNAVAAYVSYPQDAWEVVGVDVSDSVMTLFAEQDVRGSIVGISGGKPTPGFAGIHEIASVGFLPKRAAGEAQIFFNLDSAILRDSDNQNILELASSGKGVYGLEEPSSQPVNEAAEARGDISEVEIRSIAADRVAVSWNTSRPADSRVEYGRSRDYDFSVIDRELTTSHKLALFDLIPGTDYELRITSIDEEGEAATVENLKLKDVLVPSEQVAQEPVAQSDRGEQEEPGSGSSSGFEPLLSFLLLSGMAAVFVAFVAFFITRNRRLKRFSKGRLAQKIANEATGLTPLEDTSLIHCSIACAVVTAGWLYKSFYPLTGLTHLSG